VHKKLNNHCPQCDQVQCTNPLIRSNTDQVFNLIVKPSTGAVFSCWATFADNQLPLQELQTGCRVTEAVRHPVYTRAHIPTATALGVVHQHQLTTLISFTATDDEAIFVSHLIVGYQITAMPAEYMQC